MDELEKNMPEDFWRKAFDEASEAPPPRVWNAIERQLDDSNKTKVLPLWGIGLMASRPVAWAAGIAAAVTLLCIGWWALHTASTDREPISAVQASRVTENKPVQSPSLSEIPSSNGQHESVGQGITSAMKPGVSSNTPQLGRASSGTMPFGKRLSDEQRAVSVMAHRTDELFDAAAAKAAMRSSLSNSSLYTPSPASNRVAVVSFTNAQMASNILSAQSAQSASYEALSGRSLRLRDLRQIHRIVWFRPVDSSVMPEVAKASQKNRDVWASASVMPGAFNPMVTIRSAPMTAVSASLDALKGLNNSQQVVSSHANFAIAYQASAGVQLNDRWSVESGVGYLAGRSTIETPTQVVSNQSLYNSSISSSNLYIDAIRNSTPRNDAAYSVPQNYSNLGVAVVQNGYGYQSRQVLTNNYQYMQVPVQVGYQLRPKKRLSLAVLGGLITNIFVKNTVDNEVVVTAKDGVYRPVSFGATMGARLRYRPSQQWSASLAGIYQPSLGLGTQADAQVQSKPTTTGMSFGVDYHF